MATLEEGLAATRIVPPLDDLNRPFWTGGADGELRILWCESCRRWVHPPVPRCGTCGGPLVPRATSGTGTVFTFTVNRHPYNPEVPLPYVIAVVELAEQPDLRVATNIVNCAPDDVAVGMSVRVVFEQHDGVYVPLFEPAPA